MNKQEVTLEPEHYFTQLSSAILEFTTYYQKWVVLKILDSDDYIKEQKRFFFTVISKSVGSLEATNILIRNFNSKRNYHPSLFIGLRAIIADIIVAEFVINNGKSDTDRNELIKSINYDHVDNILKSIQGTAKMVYSWTNEETQENINTIKESKNSFFNDDGSPKYKPISTSPLSLIKRIFSESSSSQQLKLLKRSYDLYSTLSKYEHIGDLSFWLIHRGYENSQMKKIVYELYDAICISITALNNYVNLWDDLPTGKLDHLKSIENKIVLMQPEKLKSI